MDLHNINTEEMKLRKTTYPMGLRLHHRAALTLLLILSLFFASCSKVEVPAQYSETAKLPAVYPDYTNVTVPVNIAPLTWSSPHLPRTWLRATVLATRRFSVVA